MNRFQSILQSNLLFLLSRLMALASRYLSAQYWSLYKFIIWLDVNLARVNSWDFSAYLLIPVFRQYVQTRFVFQWMLYYIRYRIIPFLQQPFSLELSCTINLFLLCKKLYINIWQIKYAFLWILNQSNMFSWE